MEDETDNKELVITLEGVKLKAQIHLLFEVIDWIEAEERCFPQYNDKRSGTFAIVASVYNGVIFFPCL